MRLTITLLALFALASSSAYAETPENPYAKNYVARAGVKGSVSQGQPRVFRGTDKDADYQRLLEDGFDMLGSSTFQDGEVSPQQLGEQAKKVGADVALVYSTALTKVPESLKLKQAKAAKEDEEEDEIRIEKDAPVGQLVTRIPQFFDYYATYWVRLPPPLLGLHVQERPADEEKPGLAVVAVIKGSPAAAADLRKGDVVLKIGDVDTKDGDTLVREIRANAGKTVEITWLREDMLMQKNVQLNAK